MIERIKRSKYYIYIFNETNSLIYSSNNSYYNIFISSINNIDLLVSFKIVLTNFIVLVTSLILM